MERVAVTWRHAGGRKPENVVYVGRPSRWGNPYRVEEYGRDEALATYRLYAHGMLGADPTWLEPLRGRDLACYCRPDEACHADVLVEMVSTTATGGADDPPWPHSRTGSGRS